MTDYSKKFPDIRDTGETELRKAQLVMLRMLCIIDDICREYDLDYWLCSGTLLGAIRHKGFIPWDDDLDICMPREDYESFLEIAQNEFPEDMFLQTRKTDPLYDYLPLPCKVRDNKSYILSEGLENKKYNMGLFVDIFPMDKYHTQKKVFKSEMKMKNHFAFLTKGFNCYYSKDKSLSRKLISYLNPLFRFLIERYLKQAYRTINNNKKIVKNYQIGHGLDTPWRRYFAFSEIFPLRETEFESYQFKIPYNAKSYLTQLYGENFMTPPPEYHQIPKHTLELNSNTNS